MKVFIHGVSFFACLVIGLHFLKFWKVSRDKLFGFFCASFWILGLERFFIASSTSNGDEIGTWIYLLRILAFLLILFAIVDKNRSSQKSGIEP